MSLIFLKSLLPNRVVWFLDVTSFRVNLLPITKNERSAWGWGVPLIHQWEDCRAWMFWPWNCILMSYLCRFDRLHETFYCDFQYALIEVFRETVNARPTCCCCSHISSHDTLTPPQQFLVTVLQKMRRILLEAVTLDEINLSTLKETYFWNRMFRAETETMFEGQRRLYYLPTENSIPFANDPRQGAFVKNWNTRRTSLGL